MTRSGSRRPPQRTLEGVLERSECTLLIETNCLLEVR